MLKNLQASFRLQKGLKLPQQIHNLWVYYFTTPTSQAMVTAPKKSQINGHYSNFNFQDISLKALYNEVQAVESNPEESLPVILHLDQPISQHYFRFCSTILVTKVDPELLMNAIDEATPQLMRALIAFSYQLKKELDNIKNKQENTFFPFNYLTEFSNLVSVLLKTRGRSFKDFLYLLTPILEIFGSKEEKGSIIYETAQSLFLIFLEFIENHKCEIQELTPVIKFMIDFFKNYQEMDEKFSEFCVILTQNTSIYPLISKNSYDDFINHSIFVLTNICNSPISETMFDLGMTILKAITATVNQFKLKVKIAQILLKFVEWSTQNDQFPELIFPTEESKHIVDSLSFRPEFEFISQDLFDNSILNEKESFMLSISPQLLSLSSNLSNIISTVAELCTKSQSALEDILVTFPKKGLLYVYLAVSILFLCRPQNVGEIITHTKTWDYFVSKSVINDNTLYNRNNVDSNIINLKDMILTILFNSPDSNVSSAFGSILDPNYPTVVYKIMQMINSIISDDFVSECSEGSIFDNAMRCYTVFKKYLLLHKDEPKTEDMKYMAMSKSAILVFIHAFRMNEKCIKSILFSDRRVDFIISLLFEKKSFSAALDIICKCLEQENVGVLIKQLNILIRKGFDTISVFEWQELISVLIDCVSVSISSNDKNVINSFIKSGSIATFSKIPNAFVTMENGAEVALSFLHKSIMFFTSLVQNMKNIGTFLSDPQWNFVGNMSEALRFAKINEETVDLLFNITKDGGTLWVKEGIELLFVAAEKKELQDKIFSFLIQLTNKSIANRYQCFRANAITSLIHFIDRNPTISAFELFKNISTSYFKVGDLSITVKLLAQAHKEYAVHLVNVLMGINESLDFYSPRSFFHFTPTSTFRIPPFTIPATFTISMNIYMPKKYKKKRQLFALVCEDQKIVLNLIINKFILEITNKDKENQFQLYNAFELHKWTKFEILINPTTVTLNVNGEMITSAVIPKKFKFEKPVTFLMGRIEADIQYIGISSRDNFSISFSPKLVSDGKVVNIANSKIIKNAQFYGLPVPFTITLVDAVPPCGGPRIFLPLFKHIESKEFFKQLLEFIRTLLRVNEAMFEPQFFRGLAHTLIKVKVDYYNSDIVEVLFLIYKVLKSELLRAGMLTFIFGNFSLWSRMKREQQILLYSSVFTNLFKIDPEIFIKTLKFHELLLHFSMIFEGNDSSVNTLQKSTSCLLMMSQKSFTLLDAQYLTASAMYTNANEMCIKSLYLLTNLVTENSSAIITYLKKFGVFQPFISALNSIYEKTRIIAINSIYYIQSITNSKSLSVELIDSIRVLNVTDMTNATLYNILAYMTRSVDPKDFPNTVDTFDFTRIKAIYFPQFLPLFAHVVAMSEPELQKQALDYFKQSIVKYPESRHTFTNCSLWIFWFIFLGNVDKNREEWLDLICNIISSNDNVSNNIEIFQFSCHIYGINPSSYTRRALNDAITQHPSLKTAQFIIQYLFFFIDAPIAEPVMEDLIHTFCQKTVMTECPKYEYKFDTIIHDFVDLKMAIEAVKIMISHGQDYLIQTSVFTVMNFTLVCFTIRQIACKNQNEASELVKSLLASFPKILNKPELAVGLLLIYQYFGDDSEFSGALLKMIQQVDTTYAGMKSENIMGVVDQNKETFERNMMTIAGTLDGVVNQRISAYHEKVVNAVSHIFADENLTLFELRNSYSTKLYQAKLEAERFIRSNLKYYKIIQKRMKMQNGGPWFQIPPVPHYKFDNVLDPIGRHNKMAIKFHFNDHKDASTLRDTGVELSEQERTRNIKIGENQVEEVESPNDFNLELDCQMVTASKYFKGAMYVSSTSIYFEAKQTTDAFGDELNKTSKLIEISCDQIKFILKRRYLYVDCATEVFTVHNRSYFFVLPSEKHRVKFFKEIDSIRPTNLQFIQWGDSYKIYTDLKLGKRWNSGEISNYEYLYWLNLLSGRSIHDISQYPVFPWVIGDYKGSEIDLSKPENYRDLSKPIGALNEKRITNLRYLYSETKTTPFACLYRFHYTAPAYIIAFLIRNEPFTSLHIQLQNGKFDHANRLFYSVPASWESVTSTQSDFRELIPEFFATPEFLLNSEGFDLGYRNDLVPLPKDYVIPEDKIDHDVEEKNKNQTNTNPDTTTETKEESKDEVNNETETKGNNEEAVYESKEKKNQKQVINEVKSETDNNENKPFVIMDIVPGSIKKEKPRLKEKIVRGKNGQQMLNKKIPVDDVELPPWAPSAAAFVAINRIALESPIVSSTLHAWIDLVFGTKQRSEKFDNLYHPFSYLSTLEKDPDLLPTVQQHAANFGITPFQLFSTNQQPRKFIPRSHILNSPKQLFFTSTKITSFEDNILRISAAQNVFYALFETGKFTTFGFNDKNQCVPLRSSSLELNAQLPTNRVFIDPQRKSIILSLPWSQGFARIQKMNIYEPKNPHSTIVTAIGVDSTFVVTGAGDASLIVWNIEKEQPQCRIVAHTESITAVAISQDLEIVASFDTAGNMIISSMKTGVFLRKTKFKVPAVKTFISPLGFIASIFERIDETGRITKVALTDIAGRVLAELELEGRTTAAHLINNQDSTSFLCLAQETKIMYILRIYDLKIISMGPVNDIVKDIAYCKDDLALYLLLDSNSIHITKLDV
ncbi:hypothetical protein TRFO_11500 [Tritrichomonas foetus]|uniref:Beige/BEACH domain containing protein n=1 Tax=Tritrichomonas foetus TaxID=1144522 RepID=A0A1J4J8I6_9EUKA|nr:hypothetical protein TRFO_11500 [Tritrichomonas foetus]|eukprot:OHS94003.1 hypothetical protein TRFO_11500 [Tritrichomonas foetus]